MCLMIGFRQCLHLFLLSLLGSPFSFVVCSGAAATTTVMKSQHGSRNEIVSQLILSTTLPAG